MPRHRPQLDTLRLLAFFAVFFFHIDDKAYSYGRIGVPLFFVLSGFLITRILVLNETGSLKHDLGVFYARRTLRIFPLYYSVLLVLLIGGFLSPGEPALGAEQPSPWWFFLYLQNVYLFAFHHWTGMTNHFWSLCVEEQFYLLYPLLVLLSPGRWRPALLVALLAGSLATRSALGRLYPDSYSWALLPVTGEYLIWGCLAGLYDVQRGERMLRAGRFLVLGAAIHLVVALDEHGERWLQGIHQTLHGIGFALIVLGLWRLEKGWLLRVFSLAPIVYLGRISYGLYVFHNFTYGGKRLLVGWLPAAQVLPGPLVALGLTILMAMASWYLLERPLNQLKEWVPYGARRQDVNLPSNAREGHLM